MTRFSVVVKRIAALALAGGVLLSSAAAGVHDPTCPHHQGDGTAAGGTTGQAHAPAHGVGADAHGDHHVPGSDAEDCRCLGGLCALSTAMETDAPSTGPVRPGGIVRTATLPPVVATATLTSGTHLLPPATGPPARA